MKEKNIIAIDLGGTNMKIALLNGRYEIKDKRFFNTGNFSTKSRLFEGLIEASERLILDHGLSKRDILGIGIGVPGPVDIKKGLVHFFPNIPGWKDVYLKKDLEEKLKIKVFLDNDANLMALAEYSYGAARGYHNVVCLTLGTGVGGGLIIEDRLYHGSTFAAGELGHVPVNEKGPRCNCKGVACLEAYIGNKKIVRFARQVFKKAISLEEVSTLAQKKDKRAMKVWYNVGVHLGTALAGIVNVLNPDAIVIGGGVANAGKVLFDTVKEVIVKRAMYVQATHVKVLKAALGSDAGLIGAAILVADNPR